MNEQQISNGNESKTAYVYDYIKAAGPCKAIRIKKAIWTDPSKGNIYSILAKLVKDGAIKKTGLLYHTPEDSAEGMIGAKHKYRRKIKVKKKATSVTKSIPTSSTYNAKTLPAVSEKQRLIDTLQYEIEYVDDGIESLMITKSYLIRRLEQVQANAR
jgi:hypothetical protein